MTETDTNIRQFDVLRDYLTQHSAPEEVWEALDGLYGRWKLGKEMSQARSEAYRKLEARVAELEASS